jgi:hypothetical protein
LTSMRAGGRSTRHAPRARGRRAAERREAEHGPRRPASLEQPGRRSPGSTRAMKAMVLHVG